MSPFQIWVREIFRDDFREDSKVYLIESQWVDHYDNNGVPILWKKGDLAICCNYRTAHGRPRYSLNKGE